MKENKRNRSESNERNVENDQLRDTRSNEPIREVGQDRSENETLREADKGSGRSYDYGTQGSEQTDSGRGNVSTGRERSSRETMHGTSDMSHDQELGRGRDIRRQAGSGSGLAPKSSVTGSDFEGQNSI